jgi:uncharacterized SAM-binding protein YcdF (DUF218 family)
MKKFIVFVLAAIMLLSVVYSLRDTLLPLPAKWLIHEDKLQKADAMIVLSGGSFDRGNEAARIFHQGLVPLIICPGSNKAYEYEILGMNLKESEVAKMNLQRHHIPDSVIVVIPHGTSTAEEAKFLFPFIKEKNYRRVILLTSLYHTRRARSVFEREFKNSGVQFIVRGAKSSRFDEYKWWQSEDGLIAMNNEVIKSFYYLFK